MKKIRYTSKDIAKLAEVSRGTVDRVLHNRGKVSEKAKNKVLAVLKEIDYQPNLMAKALSASKQLNIVVLMPSWQNDEYWSDAKAGIDQVAKEMAMYNVGFDCHYFDQDEHEDFERIWKEVLATKPDGVILAPFFYEESVLLIEQCKRADIPCINFNTFLPNTSAAFIGQDLIQSGRAAASLLHTSVNSSPGTLLVVHFDEEISHAMHMQEKETGFREYFNELNQDQWKIQAINITTNEQENIHDHLDEIFNSWPDIKGAFVTTSKGHKIAQYLKLTERFCRLVGYDLLEKNVTYLKQGVINFLIHQNAKRQAYQAGIQLSEHLVFSKTLVDKTTLPIHIINKENIDSHLKEL